jgi:hypothetical protein
MKLASLFVVLVVAKALVLAGRDLPLTGWAVIAFSWQDAAVAVAAGVADVLSWRSRAGWIAYGIVTVYVAINVPVARALSSPLTWPMIHAAAGPLADSIARYLTASSIASMAVVLVAAVAAPLWLRRAHRAWLDGLSAAAVLLTVAGPWAAGRVDTVGLERNALTALIPRAAPIVRADAAALDWRRSPVTTTSASAGDLSWLRGAARGRNVVIIVLESTGAQYLAPYGAENDPMPALTRLAEHAVLFDNAYAAYPESIKGLWSTLCSKYPAFGVDAETQAQRPCDPLAKRLDAEGYRTALFHSGRFGYLGMDAVVGRQGFDTLEDAGAIGGNVHSSFGVDEQATVHRMLQWVDALEPGRRFLLAYLPIAGHHPYATPTPGPFAVAGESDQYLNALHYADASVAELLDGLRARDLYDRTLFVIFGDHGEAFGQHAGNAGHTFFLYEENVHVPYLVVIPGVTVTQTRSRSTASLLDTVPTILDLLGLPDESPRDGVSLLESGERMALFLTDYSLGWLGLRDGCSKYLFEVDAERSKLFDVCRDPQERVDLATIDRARVARYRDRLERWSGMTSSGQRP